MVKGSKTSLLWFFMDMIFIWIFNLHKPQAVLSQHMPMAHRKYSSESNVPTEPRGKYSKIIHMLLIFVPILNQKTWWTMSKEIEKHEKQGRNIWNICKIFGRGFLNSVHQNFPKVQIFLGLVDCNIGMNESYVHTLHFPSCVIKCPH